MRSIRTNDDPDETLHFGSRTFLAAYVDIFTTGSGATLYDDPGEAVCEGLAGNFGGTTIRDFRPGRGFYCGSRSEIGYTTFLNEQEGASGYVNANFRIGENSELYASLLVSDNRTESNGGSRFWTPDVNGTFGVHLG